MKKYFKIGLDVDDILFSCNEYAVSLANQEYSFVPPMTVEEIQSWGRTGKRTDVLLDYYRREDFVRNQPLFPGATEFVKELSRRAEVFFITALPPHLMGIRAARLMEAFPMVPGENIIMGFRKELMNVDMLLDDGGHNISASSSAYPVLMRRPWNRHMTGCISVNNYEEFLTFLDILMNPAAYQWEEKAGGRVIALIGPSGSGKTRIMETLMENGNAVRAKSYTTRGPKGDEEKDAYHFVTQEEFDRMEQAGEFFETTRYAENSYGSVLKDIQDILEQGKDAVMAVDICGGIALKRAFRKQALLAFTERPKEKLIAAVLGRECSEEEKIKRIVSLDTELRNEEFCDLTVQSAGDLLRKSERGGKEKTI
ncbi:MAG: guanylate kinase [Lachnospiraceae bacterium]|nr:guanylate kinase [Lachnospiraceae bacterium]